MNIIFDVADVILDWDIPIMLEHFPNDKAREIAMREIVEHPDWLELDKGAMSAEEAICRAVARSKLDSRAVAMLYEAVSESLIPNRASLDLLSELKENGTPLYCISNLHRATYDALREREEFWDVFEGIVVSCEVGLIKPDPAIFTLLTDRYSLLTNECIFIDDRERNVNAASELGMRTVEFESTRQCKERLADMLV